MVARILPVHGKGGMQDISWLMAEKLIQQGINLELITSDTTESLPNFVKKIPGTHPHHRYQFWKKIASLDVSKYNLIHSQSSSALSLILKNKSKPSLCSMHGTTWDEIKSTYNLKTWKSLPRLSKLFTLGFVGTDIPLFTFCNKVIATSDEQKNLLHRTYLVPENKIETIYNGMDFHLFQKSSMEHIEQLRKNLNIQKNKKILLCVNRLVEDKNTIGVLQAINELKNKDRIHFIIVGSGPEENTLKDYVTKNNLGSHVTFLGFVNFQELPKYYSLADLFINFTKRQNGYDLTMLQALACKTPVVASRIGSHPTVIPDERFGKLIPWNSPLELSNFLDDFLYSKINFSTEFARTHTIEKFNLDSMISKYIKLYERLAR